MILESKALKKMAQSPPAWSEGYDLVVDLLQVGERDTSESKIEGDASCLDSDFSIGTWLNYLNLSLPVGSKFLVQSRGRWGTQRFK